MPYRSKAQARKLHTLAAEGKISKAKVKEFDESTDFSHLPERVGAPKKAVKMVRHSPLMPQVDCSKLRQDVPEK